MGSEVIIWLQQFSSPVLDTLIQGVTILGEDYFFILALTLVYWCINKAYGAQLSYTFFFSMFLNSSLKVSIRSQRPIGVEGIRSLREHTATGFAFPSGHTQGAATFWYYLMVTLRKRWLTILGTVIIILMGISRLYLGVHWPIDVVGAIVFAVLFVHLGRAVYQYGYIQKHYLVPIILGILTLPIAFLVQDKDFTTLSSILAGASVGFMLEQKYIHFEIPESWKQRIINYVLGLIVLLAIKEAGKLILPEGIWSDLIRYVLIGFWAAAGAPWMFMRIRKRLKSKISTN